MVADLILYEESPLERITASSLVLSGSPPSDSSRVYLASDVIVGRYGVAGLLLVDNKPEPRWESYTDGEWIGVPTDQNSVFGLFAFDKIRQAHYVNTGSGFQMIRYFILPPQVARFFEKDAFLGDPLIDKCCRDGTLPEDFDEVPVSLRYVEHTEAARLVQKLVKSVHPGFEADRASSNPQFRGKVYFSFHSWQAYKPVVEAGEESVVRAILNFDTVLSRFDTRNQLDQRRMPNLPATQYQGVLPPRES